MDDEFKERLNFLYSQMIKLAKDYKLSFLDIDTININDKYTCDAHLKFTGTDDMYNIDELM